MLGTDQKENIEQNNSILDPLTIWLIRVTCILIILLISGISLGIPLVISFSKSQLNNVIYEFKDILKAFIENSLI